jgi:hypothetical protein
MLRLNNDTIMFKELCHFLYFYKNILNATIQIFRF